MAQVARSLTDHVDGFLHQKNKLVANCGSEHRSANSAQTAICSLVIDGLEATN